MYKVKSLSFKTANENYTTLLIKIRRILCTLSARDTLEQRDSMSS